MAEEKEYPLIRLNKASREYDEYCRTMGRLVYPEEAFMAGARWVIKKLSEYDNRQNKLCG